MFTDREPSSLERGIARATWGHRAFDLSNPNVDHSSPPPAPKKKGAKKAPTKKPGKKA